MTEVNGVPPTTKIVIKKGQGITQALLDLVKSQNMEISDGKITLKEWNATIDKLVEIQANRETNKSIFSGGTDRNDYRNSFVVHPNQEIEFSEAEMTELYNAMGVSFKATSPASQTPAASQIPAASQTPPGPQTPPTQTLPTQTLPTRDRNLKYINDLNLWHKNETVKDYLTGEIKIYDKNGRVQAVRDSNGNLTREIWRNPDGSVEYYTDKEYDASGNRTRDITRNPDGSVKYYTDCEYDASGNRTRAINRNPDGSVVCYYDYEYDASGNRTRVINRNPDGSVVCYYDYEYDASGNCTRDILRNPDGSVKYYTDYEYDASGNCTRDIWRNPDGSEV